MLSGSEVTTVSAGVVGYLAIGGLVVLTRLRRAGVAKQLRMMRGGVVPKPPRWKIGMFAAVVALGGMATWPLVLLHFTYRWLECKRSEREQMIRAAKFQRDQDEYEKWAEVWRRKREREEVWRKYAALDLLGLRYARLSGVGELRCNACGHVAAIVSFTHGFSHAGSESQTGYQCLACGEFETRHGPSPDCAVQVQYCACGGPLSRGHILFCTKCRSTRLEYLMTGV